MWVQANFHFFFAGEIVINVICMFHFKMCAPEDLKYLLQITDYTMIWIPLRWQNWCEWDNYLLQVTAIMAMIFLFVVSFVSLPSISYAFVVTQKLQQPICPFFLYVDEIGGILALAVRWSCTNHASGHLCNSQRGVVWSINLIKQESLS